MRNTSSSGTLLKLALLVCWLAGWSLLVATVCGAPSYVYDENGRLTGVVDPGGVDAAVYRYDAAGNITAIDRVTTGTPRILSFSPDCGPASPAPTTITINGFGFSTTLANDVVEFPIGGGQYASGTVTSATVTRLVAKPPSNAVSGVFRVKISGGTPSDAPRTFTVGCAPPTITSMTPTSGAANTSVGLIGTNFIIGDTRVSYNGRATTIDGMISNLLSTRVPSGATSGRFVVTTSYGSAKSPQQFVVAPSGFSSSQIDDAKPVQPDPTGAPTWTPGVATVTYAASKIALAMFDGVAGQKISVTISAGSVGPLWLSPTGRIVANQVADSGFFDCTVLDEDGTYVVVLTANPGTRNVTVTRCDDVTGGILTDGSAKAASIVAPGQNALYYFPATAGQRFSLSYSGSLVGGLTSSIWVSDGSAALGSTASQYLLGPLSVTASRTHLVRLDLDWWYTGSTNVHLWAVPPDDTGVVLGVNGGPQTVTMAAPGHRPQARFTHGTAQAVTVRVEWTPSSMVWGRATNAGPANSIFAEVRQGAPPGGTLLGSASSNITQSPITVPVTLPSAGTYTVQLYNDLDARGPLQVRVTQP